MSYKPVKAEFVPPAFRACLGPLPKAVVILPRAIRSAEIRGESSSSGRGLAATHPPVPAGQCSGRYSRHPGSPPTRARLGGQTRRFRHPPPTRGCNSGDQKVLLPGSVPVRKWGFGSTRLTPIPRKTLPPTPNGNS